MCQLGRRFSLVVCNPRLSQSFSATQITNHRFKIRLKQVALALARSGHQVP